MLTELTTLQKDSVCKDCNRELPKGSDVVFDELGLIFCFRNEDGDYADCYNNYRGNENRINIDEEKI